MRREARKRMGEMTRRGQERRKTEGKMRREAGKRNEPRKKAAGRRIPQKRRCCLGWERSHSRCCNSNLKYKCRDSNSSLHREYECEGRKKLALRSEGTTNGLRRPAR